MERPDIDAVLIATPAHWHATMSVMAAEAGKDVYCEKPACLTMAQGQSVVETARRYARVYQTGAQRLSEPHHVFAIEMARTGRLRYGSVASSSGAGTGPTRGFSRAADRPRR